jgi:PAS domain S-box-containing protein
MKYTTKFKFSLVLGASLILLVAVVGISFFWAIYSTQLEGRKDFLSQQTDLAGRGLENELDRFEEESKVFLFDLEDLAAEGRQAEIGKLSRKLLTSFPSLVDTLWIADPQQLLTRYVYTQRNDFIAVQVTQFPQDSLPGKLLLEGKSGYRLLFSTTVQRFAQEYLENFYQIQGGGSFLYSEDSLVDIGSKSLPRLKQVELKEFDAIKKDLYQGVKGMYVVSWENEGAVVNGILAQYPFSFGNLVRHMGLVIVLPVDDLRSGVYQTYFLLFVGMIIIMIILLSIFVISVKNYLEYTKDREESYKEVTELFDQQNMLLKELHGFVFFHNYKGEIIRASDEVEEVLGYTKQEFMKAFNDSSTVPLVLQVRREIKKAYVEKKEYLDLEYDVFRKDGRKIRIRIFEKIILDKHGLFDIGLGICTDISQSYQAKMELVQSENRLRSLINNLPDKIFIYDNAGRILDFHVQTHDDLHGASQELIGKTLEESVPSDQAPALEAAFAEARSSGTLQTANVSRMDADSGEKRYFEIRFFPLDAQQMISISKDITSQKIWEKGLIESMRAADQANRSKSEFLANMSHEIRTPLNGLLGIIDLLESTQLDQVQLQYLEIIKNSGSSLLGIIRDILDYSKIEAGKVDIHPRTFAPVPEVQTQLEIMGALAQKKGILLQLQEEIGPHLVVEADRDKINQILLNLVGNALKFTPDGGEVNVALSQEELTEELLMLHYSVSDTGIGISKENLLRLTKPFFQVESSATRSYQGTGLGLAIAKKMVELLGGELEVSSEPGKGATFRFSVLAKRMQAQLKAEPKEVYSVEFKRDLGETFPLRILVAEDNELNLQLMGLMFKQLGFAFEVAKNGQEAVDKVREQEFDLVFMDVQMPVKNGMEATEEIRKIPGKESLVIIGLSANAFEDDQNKALEVGMNDYLTKPLRLAVLAEKLEHYYQKLKV